LPKSKLREAISYSLNQFDKFQYYLEDGRLSIDNNRAERAIKPFVIGRKA
ncbi:MAG: transposase, partial [Colwellia sp.]